MNIFDTEKRARWMARSVLTGLGWVALLFIAVGVAEANEEDGHHVVAEATLGSQFYVIDPPYDTSNVAGFFEQYRYIRDQGATLPYFLDLVHLNAGIQRADQTYLLRLERWTRNALNSNGYLSLDWQGLDLDLDYRRYRSDSLRFFPKGTWGGETPVPDAYGVQYHSDLCPPTPTSISPCASSPFGLEPSDVFGANNRIFVNRQSVGGELALRPEGFGRNLPLLDELRTYARYETRQGYRQDSFVLATPLENASGNLAQGFRGNRRKLDQSVTTAGATLVASPLGLFETSLSFDFQEFREQAPVVTLNTLAVPNVSPAPPGLERAFFFVPDTNRFTGTLQITKQTETLVFNAGVSAARLEQSGRFSPLQSYYGLCENRGASCDNAITLVSAHVDASIPLPGQINLATWLKYTYRDSDEARQAFLADAFSVLGSGFQESPYIQERNEARGGLEFSVRPVRGMQFGLGYRFDWVNRDLLFPSTDPLPLGIQPAVALIKPKSFDSEVYFRFRLRLLRSLRLSGEMSGAWASEVAYPNDLSEAFRMRLRGNYSLAHRFSWPVSIALTGHVLDGKNDAFPLPKSLPGAGRTNHFEKTEWGYDLTVTAVPKEAWVMFATFSQSVAEQSFGYVRTDFARYLDGLIPINFYIDSFPEYKSNVKSLTFGTSVTAWQRLRSDFSASLTWVDVGSRGDPDVGSNVGGLINQANRIQDRIFTLDTDLEYQISESVSVGAGYRFQQFINGVQLDPIELNETVHTIRAQFSIDFAAAYAAIAGSN